MKNFVFARRAFLPTLTILFHFFGTSGFGKSPELMPPIEVEEMQTEGAKIEVAGKPRPNDFWWPKLLDVSPLRHAHGASALGGAFSYKAAFNKLDLNQVRADLRALMRDSKDWWPADYGHYGPLFIRMSWHSAGTYRAADGRGGADGGQQRFEPLNSWPDNANLDKARRLIQPLVDKYYPNLSWADAIVLAGDEAIRDMGFQTLGFAGGREDDWSPDLVYWGPEDKMLTSDRFKNGTLVLPLAASVMGLIYVNPEGPDGKPDPVLSGDRIRQTFGRMGMNDEETVALIAGGHTFGKAHGAHNPDKCLTPPLVPGNAPVEDQQIGWKNKCGKGNAEDSVTSGLEGSWSPNPTQWTHKYLENLFKYTWKVAKGPGGKWQWHAENLEASDQAPNAHIAGQREPLMMLTPDVALKEDAIYKKIAMRYRDNPKEFEEKFRLAWFKLIHRDLGPKSRYLGKEYPTDDFIWQDPVPAVDYVLVDQQDIETLKTAIRASGLTVPDLVKTAWAGAVTYRNTDMKGGLNGARLRLAPQKDWEVNEPEKLATNLAALEKVAANFNQSKKNKGQNKKISLADVIVLAGNVGVENAARAAGGHVLIPFMPGRTDATQKQTDVQSFGYLKVTNDGFRNYYNAAENYLDPASAFVDRASILNLTVPEMAVLTGGLRVLGANYGNSDLGVFTEHKGVLTNDFFTNLMDKSIVWSAPDPKTGIFVGKNKKGKEWKATVHDLIFGSHAELRVAAYAYAPAASKPMFIQDFARTWGKVMNLDRFDLVK